MLRQAGFHDDHAEQYARFPGGSAKDLPSRPILITFDDGQLDCYRYADPILAALRLPRDDVRDHRTPSTAATRSTCAGTSSARCATRAAGTSSSTPARCTRWCASTRRARRAPAYAQPHAGSTATRVLRRLRAARDRRPRPRACAACARSSARSAPTCSPIRSPPTAAGRPTTARIPGFLDAGPARALRRGLQRRPPAAAAAHGPAHADAQGGQHRHDRRGAVRLAGHRPAHGGAERQPPATPRRHPEGTDPSHVRNHRIRRPPPRPAAAARRPRAPSSTAATTPRASPSSATAAPSACASVGNLAQPARRGRGRRPRAGPRRRRRRRRRRGRADGRHRPHPLGDARPRERGQRPPPRRRRRAASRSCSTASSRTTPSCARRSRPAASEFTSQTDAEAVSQLVGALYDGDLMRRRPRRLRPARTATSRSSR